MLAMRIACTDVRSVCVCKQEQKCFFSLYINLQLSIRHVKKIFFFALIYFSVYTYGSIISIVIINLGCV